MTDKQATMQIMRARLTAALAPTVFDIENDSARHAGHAGAADGGGHFNLHMVSAKFAGRTRLERHRLVYDALADLMKREVHALSMVLLAPDEVSLRGAASPDSDS